MPSRGDGFQCRRFRRAVPRPLRSDGLLLSALPTSRTPTRRRPSTRAPGTGDGARRRRQGRRGRGALPARQHRPLRRRPRGGIRAGDGGERDRRAMRRPARALVVGAPARHRALPGVQLLRGARPLPAGARRVPLDRRRRRRRQHPQHDRRHLPLDGRQRPGRRHLRTGAGRVRAVRADADDRPDPRQHRPHPIVAVGVPAGGVDGQAGGRDRPRPQPVDRHQPARRPGRGVHGSRRPRSAPPNASPRRGACWPTPRRSAPNRARRRSSA